MEGWAPDKVDFWRQDQITERQFLDLADTFDIILFKCNNRVSSIIQKLTRSEFGK